MSDSPSTVFVVDDDPSVRRAVERLLRASGFRVETFVSGDEFLEKVDADRTGCVVLDVRMPGQSGFDVFDRLTSEGRDLRVIFITGHADLATAVRATNSRSPEFQLLMKPFEAEALIEAVNKALG